MATEIKKHQITIPHKTATKQGFKFVRAEKRYRKRTSFLEDQLAKVESNSAFWILGFPVIIVLIILFGLFEAKMAENALAGIMDPEGMGNVDPRLYNLFGVLLAIFAVVIGHCFHDGIVGRVDEITGEKTRSWLTLILSTLGLIAYLAFHYILVTAAGEGGEGFQHLALVSVSVAFFEILAGVLLLGKSLTFFMILIVRIQLWLNQKNINRAAKKTHESYRNYQAFVERWNIENPQNHLELEGNHNIRKAIIYYNSLELPDDNGQDASSSEEDKSKERTRPVRIQPEQSFERGNEPSELSEQTIDDVERFINDDDNLTY